MDDRQFRNAMGKFATGVTVILTEIEGKVHGMTANAFMSVSLDPKLITISIGKNAKMLNLIKQSKTFSVNILAANQQEISMIFAGQVKDQREVGFNRLDTKPVIPGAVAQISCDVAAEYTEGDHTLFIGKVTDIHLEENEPLIFYSGRYRALTQEQPAVITGK